MPDSPYQVLQAELDRHAKASLLRRRRIIDGPQRPALLADGVPLLAFCSNDYLGLASHPVLIAALQQAVAEHGAGSGASHLICGHHRLHAMLETALARFISMPRALLFSTGYMANLGIVSALLGRHDAVFADRLNHASLNDAALLSRARLHRYAHGDITALERLLARSSARRKLIISDAVFSMDGDIAPLKELLVLCERFDAWLLLDDAHGFGVLGTHGRGTPEHFGVQHARLIYLATLGKAAGVAGAFVAGEDELIEYLLQHARTYIYTTAAPPALSAALLAALPLIAEEGWRRIHLQQLISQLSEGLMGMRWKLMPSQTPIQPLLIGDTAEALRVSEHLHRRGLLVPAIRPPTVPQGTARLRITLSAMHQPEHIAQLVEVLRETEAMLSP